MTVDRQTLLAALQFRHACKEFDDQRRIDEADFELICEAARLSPSSFGFEPWRFLVIQDMALREKLRTVTWGGQKQLPTASHVVALLARKDLRWDDPELATFMATVKGLDQEAIALRRQRFHDFQAHDFRLLDSERALFDWAGKQCYIALANMMTIAALRGIDSCPIEGMQREAAEAILVEAGACDAAHWGLAVMVAFGYRKSTPPTKTRLPKEAVFRWL